MDGKRIDGNRMDENRVSGNGRDRNRRNRSLNGAEKRPPDSVRRLIQLELRRNSLRGYHVAVLICFVLMIFFLYFMAAIPRIDPADPDIGLFSSYSFLTGLTDIVFTAVFGVMAAVMASRFIVEEYSEKRIILTLSCPVSRKKMLGAKLTLVFLYGAGAMMVCGAAAEGVFFLTEVFFPLCSGSLTGGEAASAFFRLIGYALLAGTLGIAAVWFGFRKRSVPATLVASVILASCASQVMGMTLTFRPVLFIVPAAGAVSAAAAVRSMMRKVENMEG